MKSEAVLTLKDNILLSDGKPFLKAANYQGELILAELIKFKAGEQLNSKPKELSYSIKSKCWVNDKNNILLFDLSEDNQGKKLVADYLKKAPSEEVFEDTTTFSDNAALVADNGTTLLPDTADQNQNAEIITLGKPKNKKT